MAIIKHLPVRNQNYNDALDYVMFQHDELTGKTLLDDNGHRMLRDEYYLDGINVSPMMYAQECSALNKKYHKNNSPKDVKQHHYIISFDPSDVTERGLTGEKAQRLGLDFAKKYFPGFQTIVCTHTDGHNGSKNIHVHIMFNSVRKMDVEPEDFLERPIDCKAGYKHHETKTYMQTLKQAVMDMCQKENLHQVDLLSPAASKVTDREYQAKRKGQKRLDKQNQKVKDAGLEPRVTTFQTQKQYLRDAIDQAVSQATTPQEFIDWLYDNYKIIVTESRGRFSYLHPDRTKPITGRALGANYEKDYLIQQLAENEAQHQTAPDYDYHEHEYHRYDPSYDYTAKPLTVLFIRSDLRLVVNLQSCVKAQQNKYYEQKVKVSNLQQMAKTIVYIEAHGYDSREGIITKQTQLSSQLSAVNNELSAVKADLSTVNEQIRYLGQYYANKKVFQQMLKAPNIKQFRQEHKSEIDAYINARTYLKNAFDQNNFPSMADLKEKKDQLYEKRTALKQQAKALSSHVDELTVVRTNVDALLDDQPAKSKSKTKGISL